MSQYIAIAAELFMGTYFVFSAAGNLLTRSSNPKAKAWGQKLVKLALEIKHVEEELEELKPKKEE